MDIKGVTLVNLLTWNLGHNKSTINVLYSVSIISIIIILLSKNSRGCKRYPYRVCVCLVAKAGLSKACGYSPHNIWWYLMSHVGTTFVVLGTLLTLDQGNQILA